jgi:hypothetical protein
LGSLACPCQQQDPEENKVPQNKSPHHVPTPPSCIPTPISRCPSKALRLQQGRERCLHPRMDRCWGRGSWDLPVIQNLSYEQKRRQRCPNSEFRKLLCEGCCLLGGSHSFPLPWRREQGVGRGLPSSPSAEPRSMTGAQGLHRGSLDLASVRCVSQPPAQRTPPTVLRVSH